MAQSVEQICNLALGHCGVSRFIDSIEEDTQEARACKVYYASTRDSLLEVFDWPFARRRAQLARLGPGQGGFAWAYALPGDLIAARGIFTGRRVRPELRARYALEERGGHRILLTDEETVELEYTARILTAPTYSNLFVQALAWHLAAEIVMPLSLAERVEEKARRMGANLLEAAIAAAMNEQEADLEPDGAFLSARR